MDFSDITEQPGPKPYWQVLDEFRRKREQSPEIAKMSLPQYSQGMNELLGTDEYKEGLNESILRHPGANVEQAMHQFGGAGPIAPGIPYPKSWPTLSEVLGQPREGFDLPKAAETGVSGLVERAGVPKPLASVIGKGAGMVTESIPAVAAGTIGGFPGLAAMSGLQTYGETGRVLPAALSAGTAGLLGKFGEWGGQAALKLTGASRLGALAPELENLLPKGAPELNRFYPSDLIDRGVEAAGRQAGFLGNLLTGQAAQTAVNPDLTWQQKLSSVGDQFSPSNLVATGVSVLPFAAMDFVHARTNPLTEAQQTIENSFKARYAKNFTDERWKKYGQTRPPTPEEVEQGLEQAKSGKFDSKTEVGQVLASMGQVPVQANLSPIHTNEGEWNAMEAIGSVRDQTNLRLVAQGVSKVGKPDITTAHDPQISYVLRSIPDSESMSKDTLTNVASSKLADMYVRGESDLANAGFIPDPDFPRFGAGTKPEQRFRSYQQQTGVEEQIAARTDPQSKSYDQNLDQRMALVSGDLEHWENAGIPPGLMKQIWQSIDSGASKVAPELEVGKEQEATTPMRTNIIDSVSRLGPKSYLRGQAIQRQIDEFVAQNGFFTEKNGEIVPHDRLVELADQLREEPQPGFPFRTVEKTTKERTRGGLEMGQKGMVEQGRSLSDLRNVGSPLGDATAAARRVALYYDELYPNEPFDITNPKSVAKFASRIAATIRQAETGWERNRGEQRVVTDEDGDSLKFPTKEAAQTHADALQDRLTGQEKDSIVYRVPKNAEPDGTYRVLEHHYNRKFNIPEAEPELKPEDQTLGEHLETMPEETAKNPLVDHSSVPSGTQLKDLASDMFQERYKKLSKYLDPAEVEGRKAALTKNYADFLMGVPEKEFRKILKDDRTVLGKPFGVSVRDIANLKQRFMLYTQYLQFGGPELDVHPTEDGRIKAINTKSLDALNEYMKQYDLGVGRSDEFNRIYENGLNFFEKFAVISNYAQKFMVDPRTFKPDPENRPLGDYGWEPSKSDFRDNIENKVDVKWDDLPKQEKSTYFKPGTYNVDGNPYKFTVKKGENPLQTLMIQSTKSNLSTRAEDVVKWFEKFGGVDSTQVAMAKELFKRLPFVANQRVGFGITKDFLNRGYFHTDTVLSSAGILVDPYMPTRAGKLELQHPREVFQTLMEELGHSSVDFAYNNNKPFQDEVNRTYQYVKDHLDSLVSVGAAGKFAQIGLNSLRSPREMLAGMFKDPGLHEFLKTIDDPDPLALREPTDYAGGLVRSVFDRLYNMIKDLFTKMVGPVGAKTMLNRVSQLTSRAVEIQAGMPLVNRGDIYSELYNRGLLGDLTSEGQKPVTSGNIMETPVANPIPKPQETVPVFTPPAPVLVRERPQQAVALRLSRAREELNTLVKLAHQDPPQATKEQVQTALSKVSDLETKFSSVAPTQVAEVKRPIPQAPGIFPRETDPIRRMLESEVVQADMSLRFAHWSGIAEPRPRMEKETKYTIEYSGSRGDTPEMAQKRLDAAQQRLEQYDRGEIGAKDLVDSTAIKDRESYVADLKTQLANIQSQELTDPTAKQRQYEDAQRLIGEIKNNQDLLYTLYKFQQAKPGEVLGSQVPKASPNEDVVAKQEAFLDDYARQKGFESGDDLALKDPFEWAKGVSYWRREFAPGQVLESRTDPSRVFDSMKSAYLYLTEDRNGDLWFKPYNLDYFRKTFGPAFGDKMRLTENGGQWGYSLNPADAFNLTEADVARMPPPRVQSWAPTIFETMKSLFKQQGSSDETAQALAGYNMQFAALLRNTEKTMWGVIPKEERTGYFTLGKAWGYWKKAGMSLEALPVGAPEVTIRHESAHVAGFHTFYEHETPDVRDAVEQVNTMFNSLTPDQRTSLLDTLTNTTNADQKSMLGRDPAALKSPLEFAAQFMGHVGDVMTEVPKPSSYLREVMRYVPDEMSRMLQLNAIRKTQGLDRLQYLLGNEARARGIKDNLFPVVKNIAEVFKDLSRSALEIAEDQSEFYRARFVYPDTYKGLIDKYSQSLENFQGVTEEPAPSLKGEVLESRMPPPIEKWIRDFFKLPSSDGRLPTKLSIWDKNLMQFPQFALKYPSVRSLYDVFNKGGAMLNTFRRQSLVALAGAFEGNRLLDDVRTKHVDQFNKSPVMQDKLSKIALDLNLVGDYNYDQESRRAAGDVNAMDPQKATGWLTPDTINQLMTKYGVTDAEKPALQTVFDGLRNQYTLTNAALVGKVAHDGEAVLATAIARNTDLMPEVARGVAKQFGQAIQLQYTDPQAAMQTLMQVRQSVPDLAVYHRLLDMAQGNWEDTTKLDRFLRMRAPYYFSEMRPGKYGVAWRDTDGMARLQYFKSPDERDRYVRGKNIDPLRTFNPEEGTWGIPKSVANLMDEIHVKATQRASNVFGEEEAQRMSQGVDLNTDLKDSWQRLAPGREELNMFDTSQRYIHAVSAAIHSNFIRSEAELFMTSPELANEPNIKDYVQGHVKQVLSPDTKLGSYMRNLGFLYYLWGNVSSMIMQTSHQVMGLAPMLTRQGQSVSGSFNTIRKANQMVIDSKRKGGYKDPEIRELVDRLKAEGGISSWISRELDYNQDLSLVNRIRATSGKGLWEPFDLLKNKLYQGYNLLRKMYDVVPTYNSEVAFVASLLHLKSEAGGRLSGEKLYNEAKFLRDNTMYTGGKENRPGFFQWMPRSAAQGLWNLQTYANGLTTEMGELIRRSFNPKGMTPAQTKQVRKAAAQMLITQVGVSGVLGLPFAELAMYALQQMFPQHDIEQDVRDSLSGLAGDDEAMGEFLSNAAMTGIPSASDYSPDLGSRFALHGVFHVSPYSGVGWEQLVGPSGGILTNVLKGAQAGLEGRPLETAKSLMPVGMRRIWQALEQGQNYTTQSGRMVVDDLKPEEIVARAIGFRPARVRRIEDFEKNVKIAEGAEKAEQANWTHKQVELMKQGRDMEVQQNLAQRLAEKGGAYTQPQLGGDIAEEYERQTMPTDVRSFGNRATIMAHRALRGILGTQTEGPTNVDRLNTRAEIAQRLGLVGPTPSRFRRASGIDQLMQMYPHLTTTQANLLLSHAGGGTPGLFEALTTGGE